MSGSRWLRVAAMLCIVATVAACSDSGGSDAGEVGVGADGAVTVDGESPSTTATSVPDPEATATVPPAPEPTATPVPTLEPTATPVPTPEPTATPDPRLVAIDSLDATPGERAVVAVMIEQGGDGVPADASVDVLLHIVRAECSARTEGRPSQRPDVRMVVERTEACPPAPTPTPTPRPAPDPTATAPPVPTSTPVPAAAAPVPTATPAVSAPPPAPLPPPTATPTPPPVAVYYPNCDAARAAGVAPIPSGSPGYRSQLDRDNDGFACDEEATSGGPATSGPAEACVAPQIEIDGWCWLLAGAPQFDVDLDRVVCENGTSRIDENCYLRVGLAR